jgi:hypothetical protein
VKINLSIPLIFFWFFVLIYSVTLLIIEWNTSQTYVRQFVTDIGQHQILFYAINTTFSTFLLWATALIFAVCLLCIDHTEQRQVYWFYWSQILMFTYLGFDERFLFHEKIGLWLGRNDAYLLLGIGIIELVLLFGLGKLHQQPSRARYWLISAAILFALMVIIDAKFPSQMVLRLSFEELTKLWAECCLILFSWEILTGHINQLKR